MHSSKWAGRRVLLFFVTWAAAAGNNNFNWFLPFFPRLYLPCTCSPPSLEICCVTLTVLFNNDAVGEEEAEDDDDE